MADPLLSPGRSCPVDYHYGAGALDGAPAFETGTLFVAGGLYGNTCALEKLLELVAAEPGARVIFNGDFNWFDIDPAEFRRVNRTVLAHAATRGNVETELAQPAQGAGCGCGYPDWVGDTEVARSNRIMERLRQTAAAEDGTAAQLGALPMFAVARLGDARVAVVHGDAESLAGWGFSQEALATRSGMETAHAAFETAEVSVIASSHTCLPVLQRFSIAAGDALLANNGAAGMPNFSGTRYGIATRISVTPPRGATLYGARAGALHVHGIAIDYDATAWERQFLAQWPAGSDAHLSYWNRITRGPDYGIDRALRLAPRVAALTAA